MTTQTQPAQGVSRLDGGFYILMTLLGWSSVPLFLEHFSHDIDVWTSNGWRYGFSALLWAPVIVVGWMRRSLPKGLWRASFVPGIVNSIGQVCFAAAYYYIEPGLVTFSLRLQILFVVAGALVLFPSERRVIRSVWFIVGTVLVMAGTVTTMVFAQEKESGSDSLAIGIPLAVAAGLFFAAYGLSVRYFMHGFKPIVAFAAISQYTAAAMVGLMLVLGAGAGVGALDLSGGQFALLLFSSFIGIALGHVCYYTSIARLGVAISSGVLQLQPFLAAAGSVVLFNEVFTGVQWGGGAVAVFGAGMVLAAQHRLTRRRVEREGLSEPAEFAELPPDHVAAMCIGEHEEAGVAG